MRKNEKRRHPGQGDGAKNEASSKSFLTILRHPVNLLGLFFHLQPVSGLALAGGWCDRLILWCALLDMADKVLRVVKEARA